MLFQSQAQKKCHLSAMRFAQQMMGPIEINYGNFI
jgi:hypothetical protein